MEEPVRTNFISNRKRFTTSSINTKNDHDNLFVYQNITGFQNISQQ